MYDGRNSLSAKSQTRYDKLMQDYKDNLEKYRQARLKAEQMDKEWDFRQQQADRAQANADRAYNEGVRQYNQNFEFQQKKYNDGVERLKESLEQQQAQAAAELAEKKRVNDSIINKSNRTVSIGSGKDEEKAPICFNNGGKTIEVNPEKWRNNYHHLYDMLVKEGVVKEERNEKPTSDQMQSAVLRHWYNSPSVTKEIISLSDRYEGYDERFGDITIPYSQWYDEYQNIFKEMFEEMYPGLNSPTIKQSYIKKMIPQGIEQYIRDNWMNSPSAKKYIRQLAGMENAEEDDNTAPYLKK